MSIGRRVALIAVTAIMSVPPVAMAAGAVEPAEADRGLSMLDKDRYDAQAAVLGSLLQVEKLKSQIRDIQRKTLAPAGFAMHNPGSPGLPGGPHLAPGQGAGAGSGSTRSLPRVRSASFWQGRGLAVLVDKDGDTSRVSVGDRLERGWTVSEIGAKGVAVQRGATVRWLKFAGPDSAGQSRSGTAGGPIVNPFTATPSPVYPDAPAR